MSLLTPARPDALRPSEEEALAAWASRVRADREQVERCREVDDPADFYAPVADRFRLDPRREDDGVLDVLRDLVRPGEAWLDIGAGGGRYALPLALRAKEVTAVEPSAGMLDVLRSGMRHHGIPNVRIVEGRWPLDAGPGGDEGALEADVALMAHVGYDIEVIGPFIDAMERAARRLCAAVMSEGAMTTAATRFWEAIYGEPRVALPALPELLVLLLARGRLPEVRLRPRVPPTHETPEDLMATARRQLWVREGSERDRRLGQLVTATATQRDGAWALDWSETRIGVVTWEPPRADDVGFSPRSGPAPG